MLRHVRILVALAILAAIAIGMLLPGPKKDRQPVVASQVPTISIN